MSKRPRIQPVTLTGSLYSKISPAVHTTPSGTPNFLQAAIKAATFIVCFGADNG